MAHSDKIVAEAMREYRLNRLTTKEIARKCNVSPSTITIWAVRSGVPLRSRGRRKQEVPTIRQMNILESSQVLSYQEVGKQFGITKQAVHRAKLRWKKYVKPKRAPFEPGDIIIWRGEKFTVVSASITEGTLRDSRGRLTRCAVWNSNGRLPTKVGVDPNYVVTKS